MQAQGWLRGALSRAGGGPKEVQQALPGLRSLDNLPSSESKGRGLSPLFEDDVLCDHSE